MEASSGMNNKNASKYRLKRLLKYLIFIPTRKTITNDNTKLSLLLLNKSPFLMSVGKQESPVPTKIPLRSNKICCLKSVPIIAKNTPPKATPRFSRKTLV